MVTVRGCSAPPRTRCTGAVRADSGDAFHRWIYSNYSGYPVVYLGKLPLPDLVQRDRELAAGWLQVHGALALVLAVVVGLHVLAALYHQFVVRDGTLRRMFTWQAPS